MKKFECNACTENCIIYRNDGGVPKCCVDNYFSAEWHEVKEETTAKSEQLSELTTEVFDRPDCPEWANYAVINHNGRLSFFGDRPKFEGEDYGCWSCDNYKYTHINNAFFDPSDWENSLIERPAKALPDWCKVGEWVYTDPEKVFGPAGYKKIKATDGLELTFTDGCCIYFSDKVVQARPRPFNEKEMKALVGKVIENTNIVLLVNSYGKLTGDIGTYCGDYTAKNLMESDFVIDGKPCHVLEHLNEKGEWVE